MTRRHRGSVAVVVARRIGSGGRQWQKVLQLAVQLKQISARKEKQLEVMVSIVSGNISFTLSPCQYYL